MSRRSTSQRRADDAAFPIRIRFLIPVGGLGGRLNDLISWLQAKAGRGNFAYGSAGALANRDVFAVHLRDTALLVQLCSEFGDLALADGVNSPGYSSPARPFRGEGQG